jgi:Helix-turn-helix domain
VHQEDSGLPTTLVNKVHILDKDDIDRYSRRTMATRELLNVRDTARALGVHENTVRNWEARGILRAVHLPGSGFRRFATQDVERLRAEMFEQLAPATEGPIVNPGQRRSGRLVFGDATE